MRGDDHGAIGFVVNRDAHATELGERPGARHVAGGDGGHDGALVLRARRSLSRSARVCNAEMTVRPCSRPSWDTNSVVPGEPGPAIGPGGTE
jgi:hypothetical protein